MNKKIRYKVCLIGLGVVLSCGFVNANTVDTVKLPNQIAYLAYGYAIGEEVTMAAYLEYIELGEDRVILEINKLNNILILDSRYGQLSNKQKVYAKYLCKDDITQIDTVMDALLNNKKSYELEGKLSQRMGYLESAIELVKKEEIVEGSNKSETGLNWFVDRTRIGNLRLTSQYAYRLNNEMHRAIDVGAKEYMGENGNQGELNLYPVKDGTVIKIETNENKDTGLAVWYSVIRDNQTYLISYMHLSSLGDIAVGDSIDEKTVLGTIGNTGASFGLHLHMQVDRDNIRINPLRLYGFDPQSTIEEQEAWCERNGIIIECGGECLNMLDTRNHAGEFAVLQCKEHR